MRIEGLVKWHFFSDYVQLATEATLVEAESTIRPGLLGLPGLYTPTAVPDLLAVFTTALSVIKVRFTSSHRVSSRRNYRSRST